MPKIKNIAVEYDNTQYWIEVSDYDLETAEAMYSTRRWLYVAFMCHQVIEKIMKAYWCSKKADIPPFIHNLNRLAEDCGLFDLMTEEQCDFLDEMIPMNIEARYPSHKEHLLQMLTQNRCRQIIDRTKEMQLWIKSLL